MLKLKLPFSRNTDAKIIVSEEHQRPPEPDPENIETGFFVNRNGLAWAVFFMVIFGIGFSAAIFVYIVQSKPMDEVGQNVMVNLVAETPEPTPVIELNRGDIVLEVLNGAGIPGSASEAKTLLEGLGYTSVATANEASFDFATTMVAVKESKKEFVDVLIKDLEGSYNVGASTDFLDESGDFDAVITLGAR